jgi:trimethylamine--corrinoid protein Co-methyltransferase
MLCDRLGRPAVALQGERAYFGTGSDTPNIVDPYTGERRPVKREDVARTSRLVDALPHLSFMMCSGIASDVPAANSDIHHFGPAPHGQTDCLCAGLDNLRSSSKWPGSSPAAPELD